MKNQQSDIEVTNATHSPKPELSLRTARSVLECGSPLPLFHPPVQRAGGLAHSKTWRTFHALGLLLSAFLLPPSSFAQSYSIPWFTIDGGGGSSTGGPFSLSGTIGQPDAGGPMTNGQYSITGGFWALPQAVQTEGAPTLTIAPATPGFATVSWTPPTGTNWVLQERLNLTTGAWTSSPSGWTNPVTVPATLPTKFYRLFKP